MIKLNIQQFGGRGGGDGLAAGGGMKSGKSSSDKNNSENNKFERFREDLTLPYHGRSDIRYYANGSSHIQNGEEYLLKRYKSNGTSSEYGIVSASEARELLRGYKYDKTFDMWYTKKDNRGFAVYRIKRR